MNIKFDCENSVFSLSPTTLKLYRIGNYKQAIENLLVLLDSEPDNWDGRLMLAVSYFKTGQFAAAERSFGILVEKCPEEETRKQASEGLNASIAHMRELVLEETATRRAAT